MVTEVQCLVDKHRGPDPYFRTARGSGSEKKFFVPRGAWPLGNTKPNRVVDDLSLRTHNNPSPVGDLNRIYPDAIELGRVGLSRVIWVGSTLVGSVFVVGSGYIAQDALTSDMPFAARLMVFVFCAIFFVCMLLQAWWSFRIVVWGPRDTPVLFNRKTRQIHAIQSVPPHFFKIWKLHSKTWMTGCAWDRVKVRSYIQLAAGGGGATTKSGLFLVWDTPDTPRELADYAQLGSNGGWVDDPLYRQWEYVRRYMEEGGPVLPTDHRLGSDYNKRSNMFPPDIVEAAGGHPYTSEEIEELVRECKTSEEAAENQA